MADLTIMPNSHEGSLFMCYNCFKMMDSWNGGLSKECSSPLYKPLILCSFYVIKYLASNSLTLFDGGSEIYVNSNSEGLVDVVWCRVNKISLFSQK